MQELRAVVDDLRVGGGDLHRRHALETVLEVARGLTVTVLGMHPALLLLADAEVHPREIALARPVDDRRISRLRHDRPGLAARPLGPRLERRVERHAGGRQAGHDHRPAGVLLRAVDPVRELVVEADGIDLGRVLVELRRPRPAAVERDVGAAVVRLDEDVGVVRVDPHAVVVAVRRRLAAPALAAVGRFPERQVVDVDDVVARRIDVDVRVVEGPGDEAGLAAHLLPCRAGIV